MKYYSKSPEEWKKEDEAKGVKERIDALKRRAWIFLFVNVIIVFLAILMIRYYVSLAPEKGKVGALNIILRLKDPDAVYTLGEPITASVSIQNTSKGSVEMHLEDFQLIVTDSRGKVVYSFEKAVDFLRKLAKFEVIPVFNLVDWDLLTGLAPGEYTVRVKMKLNGTISSMMRSFRVVESYGIVVDGMEDFYFLGEIPYYTVGVLNKNQKGVRIKLESVEIKIEDSEGNRIDTKRFKINEEYDLPAKGAAKVLDFHPRIKFDRIGEYTMTITFKTDKGELRKVKMFKVISKDMLSISGVRVLIESPINVLSGENFDVKIFLYNDSEEDRYIFVEKGSFFVEGAGRIAGNTVKNLRVWLIKNGKILIFQKELSLRDPGIYTITALFETEKGNLYRELELSVGKAGGVGK